jgi:hypothetical protein
MGLAASNIVTVSYCRAASADVFHTQSGVVVTRVLGRRREFPGTMEDGATAIGRRYLTFESL